MICCWRPPPSWHRFRSRTAMSPNATARNSTIMSNGSASSMRSRWCAVRRCRCRAASPPRACRSDCRWWQHPAARRSFSPAPKCWRIFWACAARRRSIRGDRSKPLLRRPVRPGFVLQLEEHCQRKTVDHFRLVERNEFRLVQHRVTQGAEHHLKREADAPRLRRGAAPAHPRQQQRRGEIDHGTSGGTDGSPSLRIDTLILRGRADHANVTAHDIDGDFNDPPTRLFQPRTGNVLIGYRRAKGGERLPDGKRHQRAEEGVLAFEAAVEGANRDADALAQILDRQLVERTLAQHHGGGFQQRDRGLLAAALLRRQNARKIPNGKPVYRLQIGHRAIIQICIDGYIIAMPIIHNNKTMRDPEESKRAHDRLQCSTERSQEATLGVWSDVEIPQLETARRSGQVPGTCPLQS